jgi:hypothetical protein
MAQTVIRTQPINLTGLRRLKILLPGAKELEEILGELRRTGMVDKDEQILDTLDALEKETAAILKKKGVSLTVDDFLKERGR